jgi:quinol monooxygenase YgiN
MWKIIWEFRVVPEHRQEFERLYGADGDWAKLFARSPDFHRTTLLRDPAIPGRYLTIDTWNNSEAFDRFKISFAAEYKSLDDRCEALTEYELKIGSFEGQ